jgi:predicted nucleic acid-binding protein
VSYLIDANIISELRKGERCDAHVAAWYEAVDEDSLYLSVLVLGEVKRGIERAKPKDAARAQALEAWLAAVRKAFAGRILPVDEAVAEEWGRMGGQRSIPTIDGLLAATAKVHRMTLVTRNMADVADLGAKVLDPFERAKGSR